MRGQLLVVTLLSGLFGINASSDLNQSAQEKGERPYIDLTTPIPTNQQGLGVPGSEGGGTPAGPNGPPRYELKLRARIIHASVTSAGDFILELQLENTAQVPFDLPVSRNISEVERPQNRSRREFFFYIRPVSSASQDSGAVGFAATAGSATLPDSFMRLEPGESVRIALRAESNRVKGALPNEVKQLDVRVVCGEWILDDNRFLIRAKAEDLNSINTVALGFRDHEPIATEPRR